MFGQSSATATITCDGSYSLEGIMVEKFRVRCRGTREDSDRLPRLKLTGKALDSLVLSIVCFLLGLNGSQIDGEPLSGLVGR